MRRAAACITVPGTLQQQGQGSMNIWLRRIRTDPRGDTMQTELSRPSGARAAVRIDSRPRATLAGSSRPADWKRARRVESMNLPPSAIEVRKDESTRLYEALIDGRVVGDLAYETTGRRVSLTHSYVDEDQRHRGVASALARYALEDLSRSHTKAAVYCGFVADYVQDHPEWKDVADIKRSAFIATGTSRG